MRLPLSIATLFAAFLLLAGLGAPAHAQATRTWVSGVGDDVNPCSRTAPCKTFAGAISKTAAGGTISVLDPAGYGAVTITKSISILTDPAFGSILNPGTHGVIVNAGANDTVLLDGLTFDGGNGQGLSGIRFLAGKSLTVRNCLIDGQRGSPGVGIDIANSAGAANVVVSNCLITANGIGVRAKPTGAGSAKVMLDRVVVDGSTGAGVLAEQGSNIRLTNTVITNNTPGISATGNGNLVSLGNNTVIGNTPNGEPTVISPLK